MKCKHLLLTFSLYAITCFDAHSQLQWTQTTNPPVGSVWGLVTIGNNLFAGAGNGGIYFSPDNGNSWTQRNGSFPGMQAFSMATNGNDIFVGTRGSFGGGIYQSHDLGITWTDITPVALNKLHVVSSIAIDGSDIYLCSHGAIFNTEASQIFKSSITGIDSTSWAPFETGIPILAPVYSLKINGTKIYAGTYDQGIWVSSTSAPGWTATTGMNDNDYISVISFHNGIGFAGNLIGSSLYRSTNNGLTWSATGNSVFNNNPVYCLLYDAATTYVGTEYGGVFKSTDNGISWTTFNEGFKDSSGNWYCNDINVRSFAVKGNILYAGTDCGVWKKQLAAPPVTPPVAVTDSLFMIYPNPTSNSITLKLGRDHLGSTCIIKNGSGNIVFQRRLTNETTSVDLSSLAAGLYFIQVGNSYKRSMPLLKR